MVIHFHPFVLGGGDGVRASNICRDLSERISDKVVEVEFYPLSDSLKSRKSADVYLTTGVVRKYRFPQIPFGGRSACFDRLNSIWKSLIILLLIMRYNPKAIIGEYSISSDCLMFAKYLKRKTKLVIDMHGTVPEEAEYANPNVTSKYLERLTKKESDSCRIADYIICQSSQMKEHIINKYKASKDNIFVYKCAVVPTVFYYAPDERNKIREQLGIPSDAVVFVYSGGVSPWQRITDTLSVFEKYHKINNNSYLIVLSKEQSYFTDQLLSFPTISNCVFIFSMDFNQVHNYLSAADVGFLLRDDVTMNRVASPTKLAEYLSCGLMVIVGRVARNWVDDIGENFLIYEDELETLDSKVANVKKTDISHYALEKLSLESDRMVIDELQKLIVL